MDSVKREVGWVYLVTSGSYSDYTVHCVFEDEADARMYVRTVNAIDLRSGHNKNVREDITPPNAQWKCVDPIEECPSCGDVDLLNWVVRVEERQFFPVGVFPIKGELEIAWTQ